MGHVVLTKGWNNVGSHISYKKRQLKPLKRLQSKMIIFFGSFFTIFHLAFCKCMHNEQRIGRLLRAFPFKVSKIIDKQE